MKSYNDHQNVQAVREQVLAACTASLNPGHPMRGVVLAHFAHRIQLLAEDHKRLEDIVYRASLQP